MNPKNSITTLIQLAPHYSGFTFLALVEFLCQLSGEAHWILVNYLQSSLIFSGVVSVRSHRRRSEVLPLQDVSQLSRRLFLGVLVPLWCPISSLSNIGWDSKLYEDSYIHTSFTEKLWKVRAGHINTGGIGFWTPREVRDTSCRGIEYRWPLHFSLFFVTSLGPLKIK